MANKATKLSTAFKALEADKMTTIETISISMIDSNCINAVQKALTGD